MDDLKGKTIIITGGSRGIGKACCSAFGKLGANIVFTYRQSKVEADKLKSDLESLKIRSLSIQTDVRDYSQCRRVVERALDEFKRLDILINNAGIVKDKALVMMTQDDWKDVVDTNLGGVFNMARAVITTFLKQKRGSIVNMSSVSGLTGVPRQANYSAAKAGIIGFSKTLAKEVASYNVRVNVVCPGYINTDMVSSLREDIKKTIINSIPVKRLGEAEEVAELCTFLSSERAKYITGEIIKIDGGLTA